MKGASVFKKDIRYGSVRLVKSSDYANASSRRRKCSSDNRHPVAPQFSMVLSTLFDFGIATTFSRDVHQLRAT